MEEGARRRERRYAPRMGDGWARAREKGPRSEGSRQWSSRASVRRPRWGCGTSMATGR